MIYLRSLRVITALSLMIAGTFAAECCAQCTNSTQPVSTVRLATGPIDINTDGFNTIPTVAGIPSATTQVTQAVSDLNAALTASGLNYSFAMNNDTTNGNQIFYDVNTAAGSGDPESTSMPSPGVSNIADITLNLNFTNTSGGLSFPPRAQRQPTPTDGIQSSTNLPFMNCSTPLGWQIQGKPRLQIS